MSSGNEIERKFLVKKNYDWKKAAFQHSRIKQGYFVSNNTVRIRLRDDKGYLTIKGPSRNGGISRYEFEKEITPAEANELLQLCAPGTIDKTRYLVKAGEHIWEIDEFYGDNEGLVLAEIELSKEDETFIKPDFIGIEVTGDRRFYNGQMRVNPFRNWSETLPAEYR